jgi:hypothetical protein
METGMNWEGKQAFAWHLEQECLTGWMERVRAYSTLGYSKERRSQSCIIATGTIEAYMLSELIFFSFDILDSCDGRSVPTRVQSLQKQPRDRGF